MTCLLVEHRRMCPFSLHQVRPVQACKYFVGIDQRVFQFYLFVQWSTPDWFPTASKLSRKQSTCEVSASFDKVLARRRFCSLPERFL